MKIVKYGQFIKENFQETPEEYVGIALKQIKRKIDSLFEEENGSEDKVETLDDARNKGAKKAKGDKMSFKDLNLKLESSEISKYSKQYDSVTIKFSDAKWLYNLFIMIKLEDAIPSDKEKDFSYKDIKKCFIKFKKYDKNKDFELIGQITKTVEVSKIDEDLLIELKIELDKDFGDGDEEEFEIETENEGPEE